MKVLDGLLNSISNKIRGLWHIILDVVCLISCLLASCVTFPYYVKANNLFIFLTIINGLVFLFKIFRSDLYTDSVKRLGAWGSKYRCFYAIYYPTIAFICAMMGGFKGYFFAFIWILSGGTYLVFADKIALEESTKKDKVADGIESKIKDAEDGCPYCSSNKFISTYHKSLNALNINNTCKKCKKHWNQIYKYVDMELYREELPPEKETFNIEVDDIF